MVCLLPTLDRYSSPSAHSPFTSASSVHLVPQSDRMKAQNPNCGVWSSLSGSSCLSFRGSLLTTYSEMHVEERGNVSESLKAALSADAGGPDSRPQRHRFTGFFKILKLFPTLFLSYWKQFSSQLFFSAHATLRVEAEGV